MFHHFIILLLIISKLVLVVANYATYDFFANKVVCMDLTAL